MNTFRNIPTRQSTNLYLNSTHSVMTDHPSLLNLKGDHKLLLLGIKMCIPIMLTSALPPAKHRKILSCSTRHLFKYLMTNTRFLLCFSRIIIMSLFLPLIQGFQIMFSHGHPPQNKLPKSVYLVRS